MTTTTDRDLRGINFEEGYIAVIDKPLEWTSTDVVRKIKFALHGLGYRRIKVGHAGTLDPLATGILVVCIGRATKMVDALQAEEKEYETDIRLGATTPSFDLEHPIDRTYPRGTIRPRAWPRPPAPPRGRGSIHANTGPPPLTLPHLPQSMAHSAKSPISNPSAKERRIAPGSRVAASPKVSPGQRPR